MAAHLKGHPAYLLIGNEIDVYLGSHPTEVSDYATLFEAAKAHTQIQWGGTATSTTVTFGGLERAAKELLPITRQSDYLSLTYYPLNPDFTVRDPSQIPSDFAAILRAAKGKKILFQEVGYPSSEKNNSSQEKQAQAFSIFLDNLAMHKPQVIGANFLFMSDFSNSVTRDLAAAYHLQNAERFSSYLQTLGMFDGSGNPKQSWAVFKAKVQTITRND